MQEITQEYVKSLFEYRDGELYWNKLTSSMSRIKLDNKAGSISSNGYYQISINNKLYKNHRLIYLYHRGFLPKEVDHIDGDRSNNKIENLRGVTSQQNSYNRKSNKNSTSKFKGVSYDKRDKVWRVQIQVNNKKKYLGLFKSEKEAAKIYNKAAIKYYGEYAKLNKIKGD